LVQLTVDPSRVSDAGAMAPASKVRRPSRSEARIATALAAAGSVHAAACAGEDEPPARHDAGNPPDAASAQVGDADGQRHQQQEAR